MKPGPASARRRVLLVEDEPRLRDMLLRGVREMGFDSAGAGSAEQAMRLMHADSFPVLVLDLNLPGAGGLDLLRWAREKWPATQAIILTGFGDLDSARQAIHLEVTDFLTKPCALGDLEIALNRAFRRIEQLQPMESDTLMREGERADWNHFDDDGDPSTGSGAPVTLAFSPRDSSAALSLEDVERQAILAALARHGSNRAAAADELGISLRKLYYRLAQYQKQGFLS